MNLLFVNPDRIGELREIPASLDCFNQRRPVLKQTALIQKAGGLIGGIQREALLSL